MCESVIVAGEGGAKSHLYMKSSNARPGGQGAGDSGLEILALWQRQALIARALALQLFDLLRNRFSLRLFLVHCSRRGEGPMRLLFTLVTIVAAMASVAAFAQQPKLAPEGRGLLPKPAEMPATLDGTPPSHPFVSDPSGGFSRAIFETDDHPDFKLVIRDFAFPPDRQPHTVTFPSGAFIQILSGKAEVSIAEQRLTLSPVAGTAVPAGAPIEVVNNGEHAVVVRVLIVEAK
jgi:quercetin dioxygenase-like cupin family protein